jgi:hypothetical protein
MLLVGQLAEVQLEAVLVEVPLVPLAMLVLLILVVVVKVDLLVPLPVIISDLVEVLGHLAMPLFSLQLRPIPTPLGLVGLLEAQAQMVLPEALEAVGSFSLWSTMRHDCQYHHQYHKLRR